MRMAKQQHSAEYGASPPPNLAEFQHYPATLVPGNYAISAEYGAERDRPAPAMVMKNSYYVPRQGLFPVPEDEILQSSPFVLVRADHGHVELFQSVMNNVQPPAYQDVIGAGAGLFHATYFKCLFAYPPRWYPQNESGCHHVQHVPPHGHPTYSRPAAIRF